MAKTNIPTGLEMEEKYPFDHSQKMRNHKLRQLQGNMFIIGCQ